jgi:putative addiction module killer protein
MEVRKTEKFSRWLDKLRDLKGRAKILARIERLLLGNPGDVAPVGGGVSELKIDYGPGYRVYYMQFKDELLILIAGGNKKTQSRDIKSAIQIADELKESL